ncbi:hypothetical protein HanIR_Chr01g0027611 [Helianthus annuus]|nr:hypothetical protein HanIR_Chr01g0027611 [Helianthus annuus]
MVVAARGDIDGPPSDDDPTAENRRHTAAVAVDLHDGTKTKRERERCRERGGTGRENEMRGRKKEVAGL